MSAKPSPRRLAECMGACCQFAVRESFLIAPSKLSIIVILIVIMLMVITRITRIISIVIIRMMRIVVVTMLIHMVMAITTPIGIKSTSSKHINDSNHNNNIIIISIIGMRIIAIRIIMIIRTRMIIIMTVIM